MSELTKAITALDGVQSGKMTAAKSGGTDPALDAAVRDLDSVQAAKMEAAVKVPSNAGFADASRPT